MKKVMKVWLCNVGLQYAFTPLNRCNTDASHVNCGWHHVVDVDKEEEMVADFEADLSDIKDRLKRDYEDHNGFPSFAEALDDVRRLLVIANNLRAKLRNKDKERVLLRQQLDQILVHINEDSVHGAIPRAEIYTLRKIVGGLYGKD